MQPDAQLEVDTGDVDVAATLRPWRMSGLDPCAQTSATRTMRAARTPEGPATLVVDHPPKTGRATLRAFGPGAGWVVNEAPDLLGLHDDPTGFAPTHRLLARLARRHAGLRLGTAPSILESLIRAILQQRVTFADAARGWAALCRRYGEPAPGPVDLVVPPDAARLAELPYYAYHPCYVEKSRADTIKRVCALDAGRRARIAELRSLPLREVRRFLLSIRGVGPWTVGMLSGIALGDADAVVVADLHLPRVVSWALAGEPEADDKRMLELLAPYRPHRYRVVRLMKAGAVHAPREAPRRAPEGTW